MTEKKKYCIQISDRQRDRQIPGDCFMISVTDMEGIIAFIALKCWLGGRKGIRPVKN